MAIPTQFSVTSKATSPIANPSAPQDKPVAADTVNGVVIPAPSTLATVAGTLTTPPFPLNHARILYTNALEQQASTFDSQSTGTALNALKPNTWERWAFTGSNTISILLGGNVSIDSVCIGSHNFQGTTVTVSYDSGAGITPITTLSPASNAPIFVHLQNAVSVNAVYVEVTGSGSRFAGYISAGIALQMQRPFFNGHTPITDGDATQYYSNRTESGEIIGQQIRRQGFETSADWQNIDDTWYRTYFAPFKQAAKLRPFFFAWNLLEYPNDVGFCRISQDVSAPMQNGTVTKRSISMNLLGAG